MIVNLVTILLAISGQAKAAAPADRALADLKIRDVVFEREWKEYLESRQRPDRVKPPWGQDEWAAAYEIYEVRGDFPDAFARVKMEDFLMLKHVAVALLGSASGQRDELLLRVVDALATKFIYLTVELQTDRPGHAMMSSKRGVSRGQAEELLRAMLGASLLQDEDQSRKVLRALQSRLVDPAFIESVRRRAGWKHRTATTQRWVLGTSLQALSMGRAGLLTGIMARTVEPHREVARELADARSPCYHHLEITIPETTSP